jgi:ribosome-binding factor A
MSVRTERVSSLIKELISEVVQKHFTMEKFGLVTVTEVRMSPDLKIAKVYVSIFGDAERKKKTLAHLEVEKSSVRSQLGQHLRLKFTPSLDFYLDESLDNAMRIENLINQIHKNSPKNDDQQ